MAIKLEDLREASISYIQTSVTCKIFNLKADVPTAISPGEGFRFDVSVHNKGKLRITKVKYHLFVQDSSKAKLVVPRSYQSSGSFGMGSSQPPTLALARAGASSDSPILAVGSQVTEMFLFPVESDFKSLDPGESDSWRKIKGRARTLGETNVFCNILGELDLSYIFPSNNESPVTKIKINVT